VSITKSCLNVLLQVEGLTSWMVLASRGPFLRFLPAFASTLVLWAVLQHARNPLALPATLLAIPLAFYAVLFAADVSLADAQAAGWVPQPAEVLSCVEFHLVVASFELLLFVAHRCRVPLPGTWPQPYTHIHVCLCCCIRRGGVKVRYQIRRSLSHKFTRALMSWPDGAFLQPSCWGMY
jgi:hypothetical protein